MDNWTVLPSAELDRHYKDICLLLRLLSIPVYTYITISTCTYTHTLICACIYICIYIHIYIHVNGYVQDVLAKNIFFCYFAAVKILSA